MFKINMKKVMPMDLYRDLIPLLTISQKQKIVISNLVESPSKLKGNLISPMHLFQSSPTKAPILQLAVMLW